MKFTANETSSGTLHTGTLGSVTVKIYEHARPVARVGKRPATRTVFQVVDNSLGKGRRRLRGFSTWAEAAAEAERLANLISTGQTAAATLTNADAASFGRMKELLRGIDVPLEMVAAHFAEGFKILGGDRIVEAAKDYNRRHPEKRQPVSVAAVVAELIELKTKRAAPGKSKYHIGDLRWRLANFAEAFKMDIARVTAADVQAWLDGMTAAPRSVKNFRAAASALFKFAAARGYVAKGENPVADTALDKIRNAAPIEIYSPAEMRRLLAAADDSLKPALALQAFAGLRSEEVMRLDWRDVKLSRGHIELGAEKTKTASRRLVPIAANLRAWLESNAKKSGKVFPQKSFVFHKLHRAAAAATEIKADGNRAALPPVELKKNALRHSFISYRVAETNDVPKVALEAGNSPAMIFQHYRELVTPEDALLWFAIAPAKAKGQAAPRVTVTPPAPVAGRNRALQMN